MQDLTSAGDLEAPGLRGGRNIFVFWDREDGLPQTARANFGWLRERYPDRTPILLTDRSILPLLHRNWPVIAESYARIRVPACRSDIARIAALQAFGGWYLDADIRCTADLDAYPADKVVVVERDDNDTLKAQGRVVNGILHMPAGAGLARRMLKVVTRHIRQGEALYDTLGFAGPRLLSRLVAKADPARIHRLKASEVYRCDAPVFEEIEGETSSFWRLTQAFGLLDGLEPDWDRFPAKLRPGHARVLPGFVERHGLHAEIVELAERRPGYLERRSFRLLVAACRAKAGDGEAV